MSAELRARDAVVVSDDASIEIKVRRPALDVLLRVIGGVCFVASLGVVVMEGEQGVFTALILHALGAVALLVVTLTRVDDRIRGRVAQFVVTQARVTLDGQSVERASITGIALRRRESLDLLTLERGERAQPLASFDDHDAALQAQALLASRLGVALGSDEPEPGPSARTRWAITAAASAVVGAVVLTWLVLVFRSLAYSEQRLGSQTLVTVWVVTITGLSLMRSGFRRGA